MPLPEGVELVAQEHTGIAVLDLGDVASGIEAVEEAVAAGVAGE